MNGMDMMEVLAACRYKNWEMRFGRDGDRDWFQWRFAGRCVKTDRIEWQFSRKWYLSKWMTESELVMTAFKAALTAEEHECRENFRWQGKRIFNPHVSVRALYAVCDQEDVRDNPV